MITKREKLQYGYLFLIDLLSLVLSIGLAWGLTAGVLHKMGDFQLDDLVEACFLLLLAYILTFFTFDQSENIVNRTPIREVEIAVRFNFLLTLIDAACLALTKASMLHSRYFLVFVPVIDVFVMTGAPCCPQKDAGTLPLYQGDSESCGSGDHAGERKPYSGRAEKGLVQARDRSCHSGSCPGAASH